MKRLKRSEIKAFLDAGNKAFAENIEDLGKRGLFKKKQMSDLIAGHRDGMRNCLIALQQAKHLEIEEDE